MSSPPVSYAKSGDTLVAYQTFGEGNLNLVLVPGWISHLDIWWECPQTADWLNRFADYANVLIFDKRGCGLSDRSENAPSMDERMDDIRAVMDAAGIESAAVLGWSEGGTLAALFAASHPGRCQSLVLQGAFARFESWFPDEAALEAFYSYVNTKWGSGDTYSRYCASMAGDKAYQAWWGKRERSGASPSSAINLMKLNSAIDASGILKSVNVPTLVVHRTDDPVIDFDGGRELASLIPNAELAEFPGTDHVPWTGDGQEEIAFKIQEFLTGVKPVPVFDRVLATVVFTDIVDSTKHAVEMGDRKWHDLLDRHHSLVRRELSRFQGNEIDNAGDGFFATFDGPARAVQCALAIKDAVATLGVEIRAGVHIGECELLGDKVSGVAVHIGARVQGEALPNEILVSRTVKDLVVGSGLVFADRGEHELKGVPGYWQLFSVSA